MFKKMIAALLVLALCLPIGAMTVSAEAAQPVAPAETVSDAYIMEDGTAMTMELAEIETAETGDVYVYEVEYDGVLDHTIQVDLENDRAVISYADGTVETLVISEHVRITKVKDAGVQSFRPVTAESVNSAPITTSSENSTRAYTNYVYSEPLEIDANGNQKMLGNEVYGSGYELVGAVSFVDPTEVGYLIRKPMGYIEFEDDYFEIEAGTAISLAISIIQAIIDLFDSDTRAAILALAQELWPILNGKVTLFTSGRFKCREYQWHYRVRANSPYNTTLREATKCRFWWCMKVDGSDNIAFKERTNIIDGWVLSNFDLIAAGLGRIVI